MKKKYSTLLNFALAACVATALVACSDGDTSITGGKGNQINRPELAMLQGFVKDTNGNPIEGATACTQGECAETNAAGMYVFEDLLVTTTTSVDNAGDDGICLTVHVEPPDATYLNGWVYYCPQAEIDSMQDALEADDSNEFLTSKSLTNPLVTFIDGYIAEASDAVLPKLASTVEGRLENCDTGESIVGANIRLDMVSVDPDCSYGSFCFSTGQYSALTGANGEFIISNVPDDSILRMSIPRYKNILIDEFNMVGNTNISTLDEGELFLGDVCAVPITTGDTMDPCIVSVANLITSDNFTPTDMGHGMLNDETDGTQGIDIVFTEAMDWSEVDENSIVIFDETAEAYITAFTVAGSGNTLTITTADPIGDDHYINIFLLKGDFEDLGGNQLTIANFSSAQACGDPPFIDPFLSNNSTIYVQIDLKIFSPDDTNVGPAADLAQVCLDGGNAGLADLNDAYPTVFIDNGGSATATNVFGNLNADGDYAARLEALADEIGGTNSELADVQNGFATVEFDAPSSGNWEISGDGTCESNCDGSGDGGSETTVVSGVVVGDEVCVDSYDDFDNLSAQICITLGDCVAPTTVLNYAYNTCGHIGYDPGIILGYPDLTDTGWDTNYAAHLCADFEAGALDEFGDGGENSGEGVPGMLGIPTLNITCRLLKDAADAPGVVPPVSFFGLYDGVNTPGALAGTAQLYDATEWAAWGLFADTIGVAFSENIAMTDGGVIDWNGVTNITSWTIGNNIGTTDDGNNPDGGAGSTVDLVQITVDDVLTLANVDHQQIMDFSAAVEDNAGNQADNARVVVNDLLPPFVVWSYWDGDLVIQFNEAVDVCTDITTGCTADFVTLRDPLYGALGPIADVQLTTDGATLSADGTRLTIPAATLAATAFDRDEMFANTNQHVDALDYVEPLYDTIVASPLTSYNHGRLNWDDIRDANNGNRWEDWNGNNPGVSVSDSYAEPRDAEGNWRRDFVDIVGAAQCQTPEFAAIDALGLFTDTKSAPAFACGNNNDVVISTSTSHPVDYVATYNCDPDVLTNAEMITCMDGLITFNGVATDGTSTDLQLIGITIGADRRSATFTLDNIGGPYVFQHGDTITVNGLLGGGSNVYVSLFEITPNELPIFNLICVAP